MNTLNKILKQHAEIYDPHKKIIESIRINNWSFLIVILIILEVLSATYLIYINKGLYGFITLCLYLVTIAASSFWHFKKVENLYGSLESLDIDRMNRFLQLTLQNLNINLRCEAENTLMENIISEKLEKVHRIEQAKKAVYLGIITTTLPLFFSLVIKNLSNTAFLTIIIMWVGLIILLFALKSAFKEYTVISKLEHISEILKEIRLSQLISRRN